MEAPSATPAGPPAGPPPGPRTPRRQAPDLVLPHEVFPSRRRLLFEIFAAAYVVAYGTFMLGGVVWAPEEQRPTLDALVLVTRVVLALQALLLGLPALLHLVAPRPRLRLTTEGVEVRRCWLLRRLLPWNQVADVRRSRWPLHTHWVTLRRRRPPAGLRLAPGPARVRIDARVLSLTPDQLVRLLRLYAFTQPFREDSPTTPRAN